MLLSWQEVIIADALAVDALLVYGDNGYFTVFLGDRCRVAAQYFVIFCQLAVVALVLRQESLEVVIVFREVGELNGIVAAVQHYKLVVPSLLGKERSVQRLLRFCRGSVETGGFSIAGSELQQVFCEIHLTALGVKGTYPQVSLSVIACYVQLAISKVGRKFVSDASRCGGIGDGQNGNIFSCKGVGIKNHDALGAESGGQGFYLHASLRGHRPFLCRINGEAQRVFVTLRVYFGGLRLRSGTEVRVL